MKAKRIITGLIAALMLVSVCACQKSDTAESGGEAVRLKNYMTETEKNSVSIGELTLLDGDVTEESPDGEHTVEIEWWTDKDYRNYIPDFIRCMNMTAANWNIGSLVVRKKRSMLNLIHLTSLRNGTEINLMKKSKTDM